MATEVDHDAIKSTIVTILKANATLFDAATLTKIRAIEVGFPQGDPFADQMHDSIFVTNSSPFETIRNDGSVVANAIKALDHVFNYDIVIVVNGKDSRDTEEKLDDFQKLVLQTLEADVDLTASVDKSFPVSVQHYRDINNEGKGLKGRVITLRCWKTTG
jgi:hypothetical protein